MNEILDHYKIEFYTKNISGLTLNFITSISDVLSELINDWTEVDDVTAAVQTIDEIISGKRVKVNYLSGTLITIEVDLNAVKLFSDPNLNSDIPDFSLPIQDFRTIVVAWKTFLLT